MSCVDCVPGSFGWLVGAVAGLGRGPFELCTELPWWDVWSQCECGLGVLGHSEMVPPSRRAKVLAGMDGRRGPLCRGCPGWLTGAGAGAARGWVLGHAMQGGCPGGITGAEAGRGQGCPRVHHASAASVGLMELLWGLGPTEVAGWLSTWNLLLPVLSRWRRNVNSGACQHPCSWRSFSRPPTVWWML